MERSVSTSTGNWADDVDAEEAEFGQGKYPKGPNAIIFQNCCFFDVCVHVLRSDF